jgi:hypothetical protein
LTKLIGLKFLFTHTHIVKSATMGKRKSTAEDKAGEMDVDGDSSDDVSLAKEKENKKPY